MRKKFRLLGIGIFFFGVIMTINSLEITSFVIGDRLRNTFPIFGIIFMVGGTILFLAGKESNLAKKVLESGAVIQDPKKIKKIARKMGYLGRDVKEGYQILDRENKPLTVIPRHNISGAVSKEIMKSLFTGESSFRKRTGYSTLKKFK
jgi:hypothetical protein